VSRRVALAGFAAALLLTGCGASSSGASSSSAGTPTARASAGGSASPGTTAGTAAGGCTQVSPHPNPSPSQFGHEPPVTIARTTYTATIRTNCGTLTVQLLGRQAPHTVNSFVFLAAHHFFDGTFCHRLTTTGIYVLQCGDPTGTGTGGPGYTIPDENLKGATYPAGTLAMANTGAPHTGGSQFFFVYAATSLPPQYTPFGRVVHGLSVLRDVAKRGSTPPGDGTPNQPLVLESVTTAKG
jgi:peptidyl-prolyl cis-trans isomerase B (cyclophilin B)